MAEGPAAKGVDQGKAAARGREAWEGGLEVDGSQGAVSKEKSGTEGREGAGQGERREAG